MADRPQEYTIAQVLVPEKGNFWQGSDGPMRTDVLIFEGEQRSWKCHQAVDDLTVSFAQGQVVKGWQKPEKGSFGVAKDKPRNSGGGGSNGDKSFERNPDHPLVMQQRLHTSALSTAPTLIEQMLTIGVVQQPQSKGDYLELVKGVAEWAKGTYPEPVLDRAAGKDDPAPEPAPEPVAVAASPEQFPGDSDIPFARPRIRRVGERRRDLFVGDRCGPGEGIA